MDNWYDKYKVDIPEGKSGIWRVERFTVTPQDENLERIRAIASSSSRGRFTLAGTYTRLMRGNELVMSDTPDEIRDHRGAIYEAKGNVLINGLGLGMMARAVLLKPEVDQVTVIEIDPDVIKLVGKYLISQFPMRLEIIKGDAFQYMPPKGIRYDMVWHDIFDNITADNLPLMSKLHRKYGKRTEWQGSWAKELCEMRRDGWR